MSVEKFKKNITLDITRPLVLSSIESIFDTQGSLHKIILNLAFLKMITYLAQITKRFEVEVSVQARKNQMTSKRRNQTFKISIHQTTFVIREYFVVIKFLFLKISFEELFLLLKRFLFVCVKMSVEINKVWNDDFSIRYLFLKFFLKKIITCHTLLVSLINRPETFLDSMV